MNDHYETLQVHPKADQETIRAAYERMRERYDPSQGAAEQHEQLQQHRDAIEQAYAVLGDASRRAAYDSERATASSAPTPPDARQPQVIDYRPLPPAQRQERPHGFDPQPMVVPPPAAAPAPRERKSSSLIMPGVVGITAAAAFAIIIISLLLTQQQPAAPPENMAGTMPTARATATNEEVVNQFEAQIVSARQVAEQVPDNPRAWVELGNLLYDSVQVVRERMPESDLYAERLPRWLEASEAYSRALQLEPDNAVARADRAFSLCIYGAETNQQRYVQRGLEEAQRALEQNPHSGRVLLHLGVCQVSTEPPQPEKALDNWRAVLALPAAEQGVVAEARRLIDIYSE
jgi:curved DNA-binding protein CbpA